MSLNFVFKSYDHLRYENGRHVAGPHGGANRAVKVEPNVSGGEGYTVTLFNLDGNHPVWHNNVQMAPKQMKIILQSEDKIVLRGYGHDMMGSSFADYGLTIHFKDGIVDKCILHMHDRDVDIEYLKADDQSMGNSKSASNEFEEIQHFFQKWIREVPPNTKLAIARKTDELNNIGCDYYDQDDIPNAIHYYLKALELMPINDDALKNLVVCYKMTNDTKKMLEAQRKFDYLKKLGL
jgi:tetratricopeptide (TPR) repeat protein